MSQDIHLPKEEENGGLEQFFFVRHAARLDQHDYNWRTNSSTPYDTPITRSGVLQSNLLGWAIHRQSGAIAMKQVDMTQSRADLTRRYIIHTSPFLRCIQTSLALASTIASITGLKPLLRIDCFLGEWMTPDYFDDMEPPPPMPELAILAHASLARLSTRAQLSDVDRLANSIPNLSLGSSSKNNNNSKAKTTQEANVDTTGVEVDWTWDSTRFGRGGEYGEEWPEMHSRFRRSLKLLLMHYSKTGHDESRPEHVDTKRDGEANAIVILVTHSAGCNAMINAISGTPVLSDIDLAALSHAIKRPAIDKESFSDLKLSAQYRLTLTASTQHLTQREGQIYFSTVMPLTNPATHLESPFSTTSPAHSAMHSRTESADSSITCLSSSDLSFHGSLAPSGASSPLTRSGTMSSSPSWQGLTHGNGSSNWTGKLGRSGSWHDKLRQRSNSLRQSSSLNPSSTGTTTAATNTNTAAAPFASSDDTTATMHSTTTTDKNGAFGLWSPTFS